MGRLAASLMVKFCADRIRSPSTIRASALNRLAALAVKGPECGSDSDIARLAQQSLCPAHPSNDTLNGILQAQAPTSRVPMVR